MHIQRYSTMTTLDKLCMFYTVTASHLTVVGMRGIIMA